MNYRHDYHAGNFADAYKHAMLARILVHLARKDAPFQVVDTHAGPGLYELHGEAARRTGEWREGIGRLIGGSGSPAADALLAPWLDVVRPMMAARPALYPGSPRLAQALTRPQDRLLFGEMLREDAARLAAAMRGDRRIQVLETNGFVLLRARLPPPARRGLVLIDPPFESRDEPAAILDALADGLRRFATGVYMVWYPLKARRPVEHFIRKAGTLGAPALLRGELNMYQLERVDRLNGCGLLIINPPWHLDQEMATIGEAMAAILGRETGARHRLEWLKRA